MTESHIVTIIQTIAIIGMVVFFASLVGFILVLVGLNDYTIEDNQE